MSLPVANIFQPLADVEEWVLERLHSIGLGWGLAIVGLTIMIRATTIPLVMRQFRSQRAMKIHAPELKRLQTEHKGDKERLQRETMAYYREHGINPLAAMGPLLLQVPIFISLYLLLKSDANSGLFGDSSFLFIPDLTAKPTGAELVTIMLLYLSSQLASSAIATRTLTNNSHRGIAMALPLLFVGVIARFPAGLAIYSVTTSFWSLGQQIVFWRTSPLPAGTAAIAEEVEEVVEAGHDAEPAATPAAGPPAKPTHSRSKKKKRSRSRR